MRFLIIASDPELLASAKEGFHPADHCIVFDNWKAGLEACEGVDLMFVDLIATLHEPGRIAGYEQFAHAKMSHPVAADIPLVLISPPQDYEIDYFAGWPDFVIGNLQRPVTSKLFRRASTWV